MFFQVLLNSNYSLENDSITSIIISNLLQFNFIPLFHLQNLFNFKNISRRSNQRKSFRVLIAVKRMNGDAMKTAKSRVCGSRFHRSHIIASFISRHANVDFIQLSTLRQPNRAGKVIIDQLFVWRVHVKIHQIDKLCLTANQLRVVAIARRRIHSHAEYLRIDIVAKLEAVENQRQFQLKCENSVHQFLNSLQ